MAAVSQAVQRAEQAHRYELEALRAADGEASHAQQVARRRAAAALAAENEWRDERAQLDSFVEKRKQGKESDASPSTRAKASWVKVNAGVHRRQSMQGSPPELEQNPTTLASVAKLASRAAAADLERAHSPAACHLPPISSPSGRPAVGRDGLVVVYCIV